MVKAETEYSQEIRSGLVKIKQWQTHKEDMYKHHKEKKKKKITPSSFLIKLSSRSLYLIVITGIPWSIRSWTVVLMEQ